MGGDRVVNIYSPWRWYWGNKVTLLGSVFLCSGGLVPWCLRCASRGFGKENHPDISKTSFPMYIRTMDRPHLGKDWRLLRKLYAWEVATCMVCPVRNSWSDHFVWLVLATKLFRPAMQPPLSLSGLLRSPFLVHTAAIEGQKGCF